MHRNTRDVSTTGFGFGFGQRSNESPSDSAVTTFLFWLFFGFFWVFFVFLNGFQYHAGLRVTSHQVFFRVVLKNLPTTPTEWSGWGARVCVYEYSSTTSSPGRGRVDHTWDGVSAGVSGDAIAEGGRACARIHGTRLGKGPHSIITRGEFAWPNPAVLERGPWRRG
jgi:hypothetical protein